MKPNKTLIKSIVDGIIPVAFAQQPFVIIHEAVKLRLSQETVWEWTIAVSPDESDHATIDRDTALSIIQRYDMTVSHRQREGQIYETPEKPFYERFKEFYSKASETPLT